MTTQTHAQDRLAEFSLLSPAAQHQLDASIKAAQGDITAVRQEVEAQLNELDTHSAGEDMTLQAYQGDRAFLLGQIAYLDALQQCEHERQVPEQDGFLSRFASLWRKRDTAANH